MKLYYQIFKYSLTYVMPDVSLTARNLRVEQCDLQSTSFTWFHHLLESYLQ